MDLTYTAADEAFRAEVRGFLDTHLDPAVSAKVLGHRRLSKDDMVSWHRTVAKRGWSVPAWPVAYGGTGWSATQRHIWEEECALTGAPPILPFGVAMVAPVIMKFGDEAQKRRYLPRIVDCTDWWCQGYSEPGSGSDLASLKTRAERMSDADGEYYLVNGQKTWTTLAQHADMMFCLVRTGDGERRQEGISFLLIDMKTPGVTVRPILTLDEEHEVNEVWLDDVRVPVENRVGEEDKGWTYAKYLLGHERTGIAAVGRSKRELLALKKMARERTRHGKPLIDDPLFAAKVADVEIELMALELTVMRVVAQEGREGEMRRGPGPEASLLKVKGTEIQQALTELMLEAAGPDAIAHVEPVDGSSSVVPDDDAIDAEAAPLMGHYLNFRKASIYGGSNEIQKNIIAQMILGL